MSTMSLCAPHSARLLLSCFWAIPLGSNEETLKEISSVYRKYLKLSAAGNESGDGGVVVRGQDTLREHPPSAGAARLRM